MTNSAKLVWEILDQSPAIKSNLKQGLINQRALARYLIKEKKIDATIDAVLSAIRRYDFEITENVFKKALSIIHKSSTMSTKSSLANIAIIKDAEVQALLPELFSIIHYNQGDVLRIIQADQSIKILVDGKNLKKVIEIFPENKIIRVDENLAEINVHMHPDAIHTPGILAIISNELAINGINLLEAMSCFPEWLWFVKEKDLLKAYNALNRLCHQNNDMEKIERE